MGLSDKEVKSDRGLPWGSGARGVLRSPWGLGGLVITGVFRPQQPLCPGLRWPCRSAAGSRVTSGPPLLTIEDFQPAGTWSSGLSRFLQPQAVPCCPDLGNNLSSNSQRKWGREPGRQPLRALPCPLAPDGNVIAGSAAGPSAPERRTHVM